MGLYRSVFSTAFRWHICIPVPDNGASSFSLARKPSTSPGIDATHLSYKHFREEIEKHQPRYSTKSLIPPSLVDDVIGLAVGGRGVTYRSVGGQWSTMRSTPATSEGLYSSGEEQDVLNSYLQRPLAAIILMERRSLVYLVPCLLSLPTRRW